MKRSNLKRKIMSLVLVIIMTISLFPLTILTASAVTAPTINGYYGSEITISPGAYTISGKYTDGVVISVRLRDLNVSSKDTDPPTYFATSLNSNNTVYVGSNGWNCVIPAEYIIPGHHYRAWIAAWEDVNGTSSSGTALLFYVSTNSKNGQSTMPTTQAPATPVIGSVTVSPNNVTVGDWVTITVSGMSDCSQIKYYAVNSNGTEELLATLTSPGRTSSYQCTLNSTSITKIRVREPNSGIYKDAVVTVNPQPTTTPPTTTAPPITTYTPPPTPVIGSVTVNPSNIMSGDLVTITVSGMINCSQIKYYAIHSDGTEELLATLTNPADTNSYQTPLYNTAIIKIRVRETNSGIYKDANVTVNPTPTTTQPTTELTKPQPTTTTPPPTTYLNLTHKKGRSNPITISAKNKKFAHTNPNNFETRLTVAWRAEKAAEFGDIPNSVGHRIGFIWSLA